MPEEARWPLSAIDGRPTEHEHARHAVCQTQDVAMLLGAVIGWFFGMLVASAYTVSERYRGYVEAERAMRRMEREVERDERLARWEGA